MANLPVDEIIALGRQKGVDMSKYEGRLRQKFGQTGVPSPENNIPQPIQPSPASLTSSPDINAMIAKLSQPKNIGNRIGDAISILGGGKPIETDEGNNYQKLLAQEAIKNQFEDPTVRQLRQAEIDALGTKPSEGFVRIGKQIYPDPKYIKPEEQRKIDEANTQKTAEEESLRQAAEQNLGSIEEAKKGSKYFGPLGNLPTIAAPSTYLKGEYGQRQKWESNINQLLSQKVVDLIGEMKRVSKTGATGFGQLSEKEGAILRQASTALNRGLTPDDALYYLNEMEKIQKKFLTGGKQVVKTDSSDLSTLSDEELKQIIAGG